MGDYYLISGTPGLESGGVTGLVLLDLNEDPERFHETLTGISGYALSRILNRLPVTALIMAAEDMDIDAEPEEGEAGEPAAAWIK